MIYAPRIENAPRKQHPSGGEFLYCNQCSGILGEMIRVGIGPVKVGQSHYLTNDDGSPALYYRWRCECGYETIYDRVKPESEDA